MLWSHLKIFQWLPVSHRAKTNSTYNCLSYMSEVVVLSLAYSFQSALIHWCCSKIPSRILPQNSVPHPTLPRPLQISIKYYLFSEGFPDHHKLQNLPLKQNTYNHLTYHVYLFIICLSCYMFYDGKDLCLVYSLLYSQCLKFLPRRRNPNTWINKQTREWNMFALA